MPQVYESLGIKFLYPDNWTVVQREQDEGREGVTLELPCGGFFTVERDYEGQLTEELIEEIGQSIEEDYGEFEQERLPIDGARPREQMVEFRFYYLDLLIISRLVILDVEESTYLVQMQAESRDFDANEMVFAALLKQIRD